ncbi:MAG: ribonucleotide-diphosphate reductase subunit beta [Actinomycetota bacterium]
MEPSVLPSGNPSDTLPAAGATPPAPSPWGREASRTYDVIELGPVRYPFALEYFDMGCANTWFPKEIPLAEDVEEFNNVLTGMERHYVQWMLGFFCTAESLVANNLVMALYSQLPIPEARLYLGRQAYEEMNHTVTFDYVIKTLNLNRDEIYRMHASCPEMAAKERFETELTRALVEDSGDDEGDRLRRLLRNLVGYYVIVEGIFFFSGFLVGLSFERRRLLKGLGTLVRYVLKDETVHLAFGVDLIAALAAENPHIMTPEFRGELAGLIHQAVQLEDEYAAAAMPDAILGMNASVYTQYVRYIADRRLARIGLPKAYNQTNPARWLAAHADMPELVNFFEAKPIDYQLAVSR